MTQLRAPQLVHFARAARCQMGVRDAPYFGYFTSR